MFPQTRLGVISDKEWMNIDKKGLPVHVRAVERAVAVMSVSGWRIRRLEVRRVIIEQAGGRVQECGCGCGCGWERDG
jgi:hypothetical protein